MQCNFCRREGLAILPMRAALIPKNSQFNALPKSIEMPVAPQGETDYTAALLKEGYLYIFNENTAEWISYYCTSNGYFSLMPPGEVEYKPPSFCNNEPCSDNPLEQANSRLITLPMYNKSGKYGVFWFAWSPINWTQAVLKRNSEPAIYQNFMQKFDMDAWIGSGKEFNTLPIMQSLPFINDELIRAPKKIPVHITSWHFLKKQQNSDLIKAAEQLSPERAAMIVLQEPTSIAFDLSVLLEERILNFRTATVERQRKLNVTEFVESFKGYLKKEAENDVIERLILKSVWREDFVDPRYYPEIDLLDTQYDLDASPDSKTLEEYDDAVNDILVEKKFNEKYAHLEKYLKLIGKTPEVLLSEVEAEFKLKWSNYSQFYDENAADNFKQSFEAEMKLFESQIIQPMKQMHTAWLVNPKMCDFFKRNFNEQSDGYTVRSGAMYTEMVLAICAGMQNRVPKGNGLENDHIYKELVKDPREPDNFIARAGYLNNEEWIQNVMGLIDVSDPTTEIPWQGFFDAYKLVIDQLRLSEPNVMITISRYITVFAGHFTRFIENFANGTGNKLNGLLMWVNAIEGKTLLIVDETMTRTQAIEKAAKIIHKNNPASPNKVKQSRLFVSISDELAKSKVFGLINDEIVKVRYIVRIDIKSIEGFRKIYGTRSLVTYGKGMAKFIDRGLPSWQNTIDKFSLQLQNFSWGQPKTKTVSFGNVSAGIFSILIQSHMLISIIKSDGGNLMKRGDVGARFAGNLMIAASTAVGTMESYVNNMTLINPGYEPPYKMLKKDGNFFKWGARLGAVGSFIVATLDILKGINSKEEGYFDEGFAYFISGIGGGMVGFGVFGFYSGPLIFVGIILLIGSATYLFFNQQDDMQKWLERSILGIIKHENVTMFPTLKMEIEALQQFTG
ncbi:T6SS effector BTH_I2691 family protein [Thorsellia anophelis]|uniref:Toxin VasX N-terminal region domain-containing protein n=1 Tax=Thorsellia anophelis DSM 18579 TaxID=1123402 RepID=A0A1I0FIJ1_9GAMM|nr:T6SS effector BTH_I2691 family protein [Thorsellia anophelis]SET57259.1 hypothetical protein SAMN02583745_02758 [Thorsellia anophelis DSM 18579]